MTIFKKGIRITKGRRHECKSKCKNKGIGETEKKEKERQREKEGGRRLKERE